MRSEEFIVEAEARIQHAEDLVFWEGSKGAMRAVNSLANMAKGDGHKAATIKWDGSPAVIFGRDLNGDFILTDKSGFGAKGYDGKPTNGEDLEGMLLNRSVGKNKDNPNYRAFAGRMKNVFKVFESAVPSSHQGYFKGDLLYFSTPQEKNGRFIFKPNTVTYSVDVNSEVGKKIAKSQTGVVIHREMDEGGTEAPIKNFDMFEGTSLLVLPPVQAQAAPEVDMAQIKSLSSLVQSNGPAIDSFLDRSKLAAMKVSDFSQILYTYLNSKVDKGLDNLGKDFVQWLTTSKVSKPKQAKLIEYVKENIQAFQAIWQTVNGIMKVKDNIIDQLEQQSTDIKASIGNTPGGEGYVLQNPGGDIKLVNRSGFSKANRAVQR